MSSGGMTPPTGTSPTPILRMRRGTSFTSGMGEADALVDHLDAGSM
jgi:hypothetical protein